MRPQRSSPESLLRRAGACLAVVVGLSATYSCSLIIDGKTQQCQQDTDCTALGGTTCDVTTHLCRGGSTSGSTGSASSSSSSSGAMTCDVDGGIDAGGCYDCPATTDQEFLDHCTGASCRPFDRSRLTHLTDAGALPPLPTDAGDGG